MLIISILNYHVIPVQIISAPVYLDFELCCLMYCDIIMHRKRSDSKGEFCLLRVMRDLF